MRRALAFAAGLGRGYIDEDRYQDRQALLDREMALRESEYQTRKSIADEQLKRIQDEGKLKTALADAAKQAEVKQSTTLDTGDGAKVYDMPAGVNSQDVASSDARQFKRNAEATGAEVPAPKIDSTTTVNGKAYDSTSAGMRAAQEFNDPAARASRIAMALEQAGRPDSAIEFRERAERHKQAMYEAGRQALFQRGADMIGAGDFQGLAQAYAGYKDGRSAVFEPSGKGGQFVIYDDATKKEIGRIPITGNPNADVLTWQRVVYPDRAAEAAAAAERERNKPYTLKPGEQRFAGETRLNENPNLTSADARVATAGLGSSHGSTGSGGSGRAPKTALDEASSMLNNSIKEAGTKAMSEGQIASAQSALHEILQINPSVPPASAANAALIYAQDPKTATPKFNPATGNFDDVVKTDFGNVAVRKNSSTFERRSDNLTNEQVRAAIPQMLGAFGDKKTQELAVAAAFDSGAMSALVEKAVLARQALPAFKSLTPEQQAADLAAVRAQTSAMLRERLSWITTYAPDMNPAKDKGKPRQPVAANEYVPPSNSWVAWARSKEEARLADRASAMGVKAAADSARAEALSQRAASALSLQDVEQRRRAAFAIQSSPDFGLMARDTQRAIYSAVHGK